MGNNKYFNIKKFLKELYEQKIYQYQNDILNSEKNIQTMSNLCRYNSFSFFFFKKKRQLEIEISELNKQIQQIQFQKQQLQEENIIDVPRIKY